MRFEGDHGDDDDDIGKDEVSPLSPPAPLSLMPATGAGRRGRGRQQHQDPEDTTATAATDDSLVREGEQKLNQQQQVEGGKRKKLQSLFNATFRKQRQKHFQKQQDNQQPQQQNGDHDKVADNDELKQQVNPLMQQQQQTTTIEGAVPTPGGDDGGGLNQRTDSYLSVSDDELTHLDDYLVGDTRRLRREASSFRYMQEASMETSLRAIPSVENEHPSPHSMMDLVDDTTTITEDSSFVNGTGMVASTSESAAPSEVTEEARCLITPATASDASMALSFAGFEVSAESSPEGNDNENQTEQRVMLATKVAASGPMGRRHSSKSESELIFLDDDGLPSTFLDAGDDHNHLGTADNANTKTVPVSPSVRARKAAPTTETNPSMAPPPAPPPALHHCQSSVWDLLQLHNVVSSSERPPQHHASDPATTEREEESLALRLIFAGFCIPAVEDANVVSVLDRERRRWRVGGGEHYQRSINGKEQKNNNNHGTPSPTLFWDHQGKRDESIFLSDNPVIRIPSARDGDGDGDDFGGVRPRVVDILTAGLSSLSSCGDEIGGGRRRKRRSMSSSLQSVLLLTLPQHFVCAFLRILIRLLSQESDEEYDAACFAGLPLSRQHQGQHDPTSFGGGGGYRGPSGGGGSSSSLLEGSNSSIDVTDDPPMDPDHATRRSHLVYGVARFQCDHQHWRRCARRRPGDEGESGDEVDPGGGDDGVNNSVNKHEREEDERPALTAVLQLWEIAADEVLQYGHLLPPLARLLGLMGTAGVTPFVLRRMLHLVQFPQQQHQSMGPRPSSPSSSSLSVPPQPCHSSPVLVPARVSLVRAVKTAAAGSSRSSLLSKISPPRHFFSFGGCRTGQRRAVSGLSSWPFRNDFGMAVWFRAEHFHSLSLSSTASSSRPIVLLSARTDDGGGVSVSLVRIGSNPLSNACTVAVSVYDSGSEGRRYRDEEVDEDDPYAHSIKVSGCVLLPRVWYHLAIRHTRSRLKGVFSLSTRQQLTVMLDGKIMLTEPLPFPKIAESPDHKDDKNSLLPTTLRRNQSQAGMMNLNLCFGANLDGQAGALYLFDDNVSDATLRALYEATGGKGRGGLSVKRSSSSSEGWDSRRGDMVRRARVLDVRITNDDADEIVLSKRRPTGQGKTAMSDKHLAIVDVGGQQSEEQEEEDLPSELQRASFGSKVFMAWDPRRTLGSLALELHVGAHLHLKDVYSWNSTGAQDVIGSIGGVQSLVPIFRSVLMAVEKFLERCETSTDGSTRLHAERMASFSALPDLFRLLAAFIEDHGENARELLRCGGVDVIEQLIHSSKRSSPSEVKRAALPSSGVTSLIFKALNTEEGLASNLVGSLLTLRSASSRYVGLETKVFSRLVFNIRLWLGGLGPTAPGALLHAFFLPVLSSLTRMNPGKVRDCVGIRDMVCVLRDYCVPTNERCRDGTNRFERNHRLDIPKDLPLSGAEGRRAQSFLFGMIFDVLASGTSPSDLSPFMNLISFNLESEWGKGSLKGRLEEEEARGFTVGACTVLYFLLQVRPPVPGLFESFAHSCGSIQSAVGWILGSMVNCSDDRVRSLGVRCLFCFLDVTSKGADLPLSFGSAMQSVEAEPHHQSPDIGSPVKRASSRLGILAKGLVAMGPGVRGSTKTTARLVVKLMWHLLKANRACVGNRTHAALCSWITESRIGQESAESHVAYLRSHLIVYSDTLQFGFRLSMEWAESALEKTSSIVGKSCRNPLALGCVLRLLRFLRSDVKDRWLSDLLTLAKASRRSISMFVSLPESQPSLFQLVSETLELVSLLRQRDSIASKESGQGFSAEVDSEQDPSLIGDSLDVAERRLAMCLELYTSLLGHVVREGGNKALEAVEMAASLRRVCANGHEVLLLLLSGLCANIFDQGTLLDMGSISAQDWKDVDLDQDSLLLKRSAKLITDAILSKGATGLDMAAAVRSWRCLRHLTEVIVAVVTKSGFGVVDLFDYINHQASSIDRVSGGLHGIRLPDGKLNGIDASAYIALALSDVRPMLQTGDGTSSIEVDRCVDRRLCVNVSAQMLTLLDAFIFPESLDTSLPASQLHGLALVRNSEARLGTSQGPLLSSAIRLSFLLLASLEPCSVKFLQCASRLRCLLYWALELVRESAASEGQAVAFHGSLAHVDRLILAIVLHCHRALGRCAALSSEIDSSSYDKYFKSRDAQRKHHRRLLRVALELRDTVSTAFRGRNEVLRSTLDIEAYESLRASLEGSSAVGKVNSKEAVIRDFLSSDWVSGFQDVDSRREFAIPEQIAMEMVPVSSDYAKEQLLQGFMAIERLSDESNNIVSDFEKAVDSCFEEYLESQRQWAETDAVRQLENDGDTTIKRLIEKHRTNENEAAKDAIQRRTGADNRWRVIQRKAVEPWRNQTHWRLARYTDRLGRRVLLVPNQSFSSHKDASYDLALGKEREKEERARQKRLLEKKELSDVMRRNAEAFVSRGSFDDDLLDDESILQMPSDGESITDVETASVESTSHEVERNPNERERKVDEPDHDEEWDKIESEEIQDVDAEGDVDAWAKVFIWTEGESVVARFEPVMIVSLQTSVEGKLLLTTHGLYFQQVGDEINVMTKEPVEIIDGSSVDPRGRRWRLSRLTEVHGRRYMLRPQAVELFFSDSHELFLNFPGGGKERDRFHAKLRNSCKVPMLWSPKSLNPRMVFRRSRLTEQWKKRRITNFEYLMALNRIAGRSFNDITQYPVFPWVLADYSSESIDLSDSRIYRDLSKPVGALNADRLAQLLERYKDLELFGFSEAEKFLYGSHYSSPGIVLHYLIRQEPFTTMAIELQSGRFDCPDRLFFDITSSWNSSMTSTTDMKELIPEFFYLPEMFLNTNRFPLGRTQSGRNVDHVGLPPWAKGSAFEFVRIHRLALESEFVSQNLHQWIDLIFGFKQRGAEAEAAHNVFHHLSYEGSVDLDKISDEVDRNAAESHIQNFGQTPSQLIVDEPHPCRYMAEECWKPLISDASRPGTLRCHTPSKQFANKPTDHAKGAVLKIHILSDTIVVIYADLTVGTYRWFPSANGNRLRMEKLRPMARRELSYSRVAMKRGTAVSAAEAEKSALSIGNWSFAITLGGLAREDIRRKAVLATNRLMPGSEAGVATAEASALIVSCGYWDDTVKIHAVDSCRQVAGEGGGHRGPIRCLSLGQDGGLMVTGGQDGTCRVWVVDHSDMAVALSDGYVQTALGATNDGEQALSCCHVLWGHESPVVCVALDSEMDVAVSGSQRGLVCVHTVRRGEFVRSFSPPALSETTSGGAVSKLALGSHGTCCVHMQDEGLHTFTVNGVRLCTVDAGEKLNDMNICSNDEILVSGGERCQALLRTVVDLQVCAVLDLARHGPIRCLSLTPDDLNHVNQYLFIGSDDGMVTFVDHDPKSQQQDETAAAKT